MQQSDEFYYNKLLEQIKNSKNKDIFFWGASLFLENFLKKYDLSKYNIKAIVDGDVNKQGEKRGGYKIISPKELATENNANILFTIKNSSISNYMQLKLFLKNAKFKQNNVELCQSIFNDPEEFENLNIAYCPFHDEETIFLPYGVVPRKGVCCSKCKSLERHRYLYFIYKTLIPSDRKVKILHIAPEKSIRSLFLDKENIDYISIDLEPEKYPFAPECLKMNALDLKFPDNTFDFILVNHVIEHIEDERAFVKEMQRVIKHDGKILLTTPIYNIEKTIEDPSVKSEEERLKYFGQKDHVRKYGKDIFRRMKKYGTIRVIENIFPEKLSEFMTGGGKENSVIVINRS